MNIYYKEIEKYFLQSFLSKKVKVDIKNSEKQNYFFNLSKYFQLSGYLLNSIDFSENTIVLKERLTKLNNNYLKKILLMRYEISKISNLFDKNNIDYVVLKGMAMEIKEMNSFRHFRDLDILIKHEDLKKAYKLLKRSGYTYFNSHSNDSVKYIRDMHHIPPMINDARVIVELHHRISKASLFKSCPLANVAFLEKEKCGGVNVPSDRFLLAHTLYHGILHHKLMSGPIFLLDIKNILVKNTNADISINVLLKKLDLIHEYQQAKILIKNCKNKKYIDDELLKNFNSIFKFNKIFHKEIDNKKISLERLVKSIRSSSYYYQIPYWSPKLILILVTRYLKKFNF
jgi:hypothetical protein